MFHIILDIEPLLAVERQLGQVATRAMRDAGQQLVTMTRAHIVEEAGKKLHSRRQMFLDGLTHMKVDENTWVVNLDAKVRWIDDGLSEHNMIDDLLKSKSAKTAKDGSKYVVVPFNHKKGPASMTPAQKTLLDTIKTELKDRKIPYGKLETGVGGTPKLGLLHSFDIRSAPIKQANGPGLGKGPIGAVAQGPTGIPLLQGVRIYQRQIKDKQGKDTTRRDIMTFRIASSKQKGQGRWDHPGTAPVKLMDDAYDWAKRTWEEKIVPQLVLNLNKNL